MFGLFKKKKTRNGDSFDIATVSNIIYMEVNEFHNDMIEKEAARVLAEHALQVVPEDKLPHYNSDLLAMAALCAIAHEYFDNHDTEHAMVFAMSAMAINKKLTDAGFPEFSKDDDLLHGASLYSLQQFMESMGS